MTIEEKIRSKDGFMDFGMIMSMPLGYFGDGDKMLTAEYNVAKQLVLHKKLKFIRKCSSENLITYLTNRITEGKYYK